MILRLQEFSKSWLHFVNVFQPVVQSQTSTVTHGNVILTIGFLQGNRRLCMRHLGKTNIRWSFVQTFQIWWRSVNRWRHHMWMVWSTDCDFVITYFFSFFHVLTQPTGRISGMFRTLNDLNDMSWLQHVHFQGLKIHFERFLAPQKHWNFNPFIIVFQKGAYLHLRFWRTHAISLPIDQFHQIQSTKNKSTTYKKPIWPKFKMVAATHLDFE